ncbi:MAG: type III-A CRISPR-associated protein Csm2 [Lewinellaceae bacterium]|nr:type III-A CRISPR-associated protein Csm2 [Lewinellaceae bacterium]
MSKRFQKTPTEKFDRPFVGEWISQGFDRATISFAEDFGKWLADNNLSSAQIRNIFGEVKRMEGKRPENNEDYAQFKKDFLLLKPKIAYAAKRSGSRGIEDFKVVMDKAHEAVDISGDKETSWKHFQNFLDFFESVLAYHKAYGGN